MTAGTVSSGAVSAVTAAAELLDLHRSGALAAEYPRVAALLADADTEELARAGQLLAALDPDDVLRAHPDQPSVRIAITGHGTFTPLVAPLTAELARHGLLLRPTVSDYDGYVTDLSTPDSVVRAAAADLVLCLLDERLVAEELPTPWTADDLERVLAAKVGLVEGLAARFTSAGRGTLVLNTLPASAELMAQLIDHRSRARAGAAWREANARLLRLGVTDPAVVVLDLDPLIAEGLPARDPRLSVYAKVHLSPPLLAGYARAVGHLARQVTGRTRKCLVLDLDDTLWGGVLGEEGPLGVEVGTEVGAGYRGEAFAAFQKVVKQLGAQGVLLAVASKNDREPVLAAIEQHPGMVLGVADFVRVAADWRPKPESITDLAAALNLGVDSFVFADDSAFECGLVRQALPGVAVVRLDREPADHIAKLLRDGWFDVRELTGEDRVRVAAYREELARNDFLQRFESIEDYLRELAVEVRLAEADEAEVPRVSQLTLRTNQFNLTTRRHQQQDIHALLADPDRLLLAIRAADRFGDNGIVGVIGYRRAGDVAHLDQFLLSCRVFSRGIEQACLAAVLRHARATGVRAVLGHYRTTPKNGNVREFYPRNGFRTASGDGPDVVFRHDLADILPPPPHVRLVTTLEGNRP
jgi:FkbH-like protein